MFLLRLYRQGFVVMVIPPSKLKKFATGNGKANKEMVFEAMRHAGPGADSIKDDNQADGICTATDDASAAQSLGRDGRTDGPSLCNQV